MNTIKANIERTLNTSGVISDVHIASYIQNGVNEMYKILLKQQAVDEIRLFVTSKQTELKVESITGAVSTGYPANLSVFTTTGSHGLTPGDEVECSGFEAGTQLNGTKQIVSTTPTATTFTLNAIYLPAAQTAAGAEMSVYAGTANYSSNLINNLDDVFADDRLFLVQRYSAEVNNTYDKAGISGSWYPCREIPIQNIGKAQDPTSIEYATDRSPVYYREEHGQIRLIPSANPGHGARVWGLPIQTITASTDPDAYNNPSTGTHFPRAYWTPLIYYCIAEAATQLASTSIQSLAAISYGSVTAVSRLVDTPPSIPYGLAATITATPPAFNKPSTTPDIAGISDFLADDDAELATATAQKVAQQLSQYQLDIQNEVSEWTDQIQRWQAEVAREAKHADGDLQGLIAQYQNEVGRYQTNVQTYAQEVINQTSKVTSELQKKTAVTTGFKESAQLYYQKFINFMTSRIQPPPSQEPRQGGRRAS